MGQDSAHSRRFTRRVTPRTRSFRVRSRRSSPATRRRRHLVQRRPRRSAQGWLPQRRSEVMARNGMVATSQPLAAQAGLDILETRRQRDRCRGRYRGSAQLVEPMNVGPAGDLFAIVYIAKEKKAVRAQRQRKGAERPDPGAHECAGYTWNPANWGPGPGMPPAAS